MSSCPGTDTIAAFACRGLGADAARDVEAHAADCAGCRGILVALVAAAPSRGARPARATEPGIGERRDDDLRLTSIGRYRIVGVLGTGGMGIVYAAHDPELDRRVALKVLRADLAGDPATARARLLAEAQAMARLRHPNVVAVHEAGTHADQVYVAMELIDGETARPWLARARPWREILRVMRAAGRGLASAHARGIVHRDFKPENLLLGADGQICVSDFGLARSIDATEHATETALDDDGASRRGWPLTETGIAVGTPAYMAPEQLEGAAVDARADVFSFAVTAWEALYGERPFAGATIADLRAAILRGPVRPPHTHLPCWVERALRAALVHDPAHRTATMTAVLRTLDPAPRRRRWVAVASLAALAGIGGTALTGRTADADPCRAPTAALDAMWSAEVRGRVATALATTSADGAPTLDALDADVRALRTSTIDVCRRDPSTSPAHAARVACLDARRLETAAVIEALADRDLATLAVAALAIDALDDPTSCRAEDPPRRPPLVPIDAASRRTVTTLRNRLRAIDARTAAQDFEGLADLEAALRQPVADTSFGPLIAEAALCRAELAMFTLDSTQALPLLLDAANAADRAQQDDVAASAWLRLADIASGDLDAPQRAREYLDHADAAVTRLRGRADVEIWLERARAGVLLVEHRYPEALAVLTAALYRARRDHPESVGELTAQAGVALQNAGRTRDAEAIYLNAIAGPGALPSASAAQLRARLPSLYAARGAVALAVMQAGVVRAARAAPDLASRLEADLDWGAALIIAGDGHRALRIADDARASAAGALGERSIWVAQADLVGALALHFLGQNDRAVRRERAACAIVEAQTGATSDSAAWCRMTALSHRRIDRAHARAALAAFDPDLAIIEANAPGRAPVTVVARGLRGRLLLAAGRLHEARVTLTAALAAAAPLELELDPGAIANIELSMARVARAEGDPRAEVRRWALLAVARFGVAPPAWASTAAEARALLRQYSDAHASGR
ncbi:MAG: serine/threonine protein kinase [Deltaproteobacteria bacterium]|nr:serine/threonine protein kinase [Deltaproteobacteria bacterium]